VKEAYIVAVHQRGGGYMALEVAPGGIEGAAVFAESPSDLVAAIVQNWTAIDIYVGNDFDLVDDLLPHLPADYAACEGRPAPIQTSYL
jgi:hypothetical protein